LRIAGTRTARVRHPPLADECDEVAGKIGEPLDHRRYPLVFATSLLRLISKPIPSKVAADVPSLQPYDFAMVGHKLVIVDPPNKVIADVLTK
jgi:hypothetical protein